MSVPEDHIENKVRQKLENFSPPVPEGVWDAVEIGRASCRERV